MRSSRPLSVTIFLMHLAFFAAAPAGSRAEGASKENLDLPFDAIGDTEDGEDAPDIIVFYDQQYEGDFFCFTCDKSSSMEGAPWKRLQQEVIKNISQFSERVEFAIVFFDVAQAKFPTSGRPATATPAMKSAAIAMVSSTTTGHGSCYKEALLLSLQYANGSTGKRKVIICLGDGNTTCPGADPGRYGQETLSLVTSRNVQKVRINTLGIGNVDETWMRSLASQNRGTYRRIQ